MKRTKIEVTDLADRLGIMWDYDHIFMQVSLVETGKSHLSDMSPEELGSMYDLISESPHIFSKKLEDHNKYAKKNEPKMLRQNLDYEEGDFIEKLKSIIKKRKRINQKIKP